MVHPGVVLVWSVLKKPFVQRNNRASLAERTRQALVAVLVSVSRVVVAAAKLNCLAPLAPLALAWSRECPPAQVPLYKHNILARDGAIPVMTRIWQLQREAAH